jgi:multidrug efflux pump
MVAVAITPLPGSNYVAIVDEFYKRVEQIKKDLPEDLRYNGARHHDRHPQGHP